MTSPIGYNNPAYSHQFDTSLYDYHYVPEIDPDYEGQVDRSQEEIHLVHPSFQDEFSGASEEFEASDESNQSIIVEECNNRRVTLICEKRSKAEERYYEDGTHRGAYHHDISLESEEDYQMSRKSEKLNRTISQRHQKRLEPPAEVNGYPIRSPLVQQTNHVIQYQRPQHQHRYEEIRGNDDEDDKTRRQHVTRHRYAEITIDENGYPSIGHEIEIERNENEYRVVNTETQRDYALKPIPKPRATSPISQTLSPTFSPSKTYQRTISPRPDVTLQRLAATKPTPIPIPSSSIEMAELSPPHGSSRSRPNQTPFFQSPKRQPPIGASSPANLQEQMKIPGGKVLKTNNKRQNSITLTPKNLTPSKPTVKASVSQIFQAKTTPKTPKGKASREGERNSTRRNISNSFTEPPKNFPSDLSSPYRTTTMELSKTAIITPILHRKNGRASGEDDDNFRRISHAFQSTGNLYKENDDAYKASSVTDNRARIKRNRSVPNFAQSLASEGKLKYAKTTNDYHRSSQGPVRKLDYQYSPAKSVDRFSPINRSRLSLIDQTKLSWSYSVSDFQPAASSCLIIGAIIQIITSIASCAICFYLFSKLGRRYYIDFGILAAFVNLVLGVLGFRSQCWRWLPNRNYVSGYIVLTAFSMLTCAGFVYLITARPMSGDPILDLMGGGICGVSVLTIILSVTGLSMSGCCKSPPPDNRVNNI